MTLRIYRSRARAQAVTARAIRASKRLLARRMWGIFTEQVWGSPEVCRDSTTGQPSVYPTLGEATDECAALNEATEGGYFVRPCGPDGDIEWAHAFTKGE